MSEYAADIAVEQVFSENGGMAEIERTWVEAAVAKIDADFTRSADTHLLKVELPATFGISVYLKDESIHPTGSLKHRLARSLFLYALCNGWVGPQTTIVEASSGSTAVSEAYFARLLGLPFVAVMPRSTSIEKVKQIEFPGGRCMFVDEPGSVYDVSRRYAATVGGHYMDQFTYAERATDWRGNNNIADTIFSQLSDEEHPIPAWMVCGAGTGGTSATIGRYVRYRRHPTRLCLADPEHSVFHCHLAGRPARVPDEARCLIEGIGRPRLEPSFVASVIDRAVVVPDAASIAAARALSRHIGRSCGGSTGTNFWAVATIASEMIAAGERGSIVTLLCDSGDRYASTYYNDSWLTEQKLQLGPFQARIENFLAAGRL